MVEFLKVELAVLYMLVDVCFPVKLVVVGSRELTRGPGQRSGHETCCRLLYTKLQGDGPERGARDKLRFPEERLAVGTWVWWRLQEGEASGKCGEVPRDARQN